MSTLIINIHQKSNAAAQPEVTLALDGNLDNSTVARPAQLVFDLAALKFVSSAGARLFFMAMKQQKQHGGQTSFVNLQPQIKEVFNIMGSLPNVQIFRNNAELDNYLLGRQRTYGRIAPNHTGAP